MNFIDKVTVAIGAGNGGNGRVSFRHEKFVDRGGPDGGDGGDGGSVVLVASRNQNTLVRFRFQKELKAESGQDGGKRRMHGKNGSDLIVNVPVGTVATTEDGRVLADLTEDDQRIVVAKGGKGGFGNAHFISSTRQAPKFAEKGEPGEAFMAQLELKMIADVGVIGLPNAGKSTLLARISAARPEIADYPFTTLVPNLGVVDIDDTTSLLFADIPGLIEGASRGKGLGHEFLRHIERTAVLLHLIDAYQEDIAHAYKTVMTELAAYDPALAKRPQVVALNKIDGLDEEIVRDQLAKLQNVVPKGTALFAISAQAGRGLRGMLFATKAKVAQVRAKSTTIVESAGVHVHRLPESAESWSVEREGDVFVVRGEKIEHFARRTDFKNEEALQRLRDIMQRMGIMHELVRQGIRPGQTIGFLNGQSLKY